MSDELEKDITCFSYDSPVTKINGKNELLVEIYFNSSQNDTKAFQGCRIRAATIVNLSFCIVAVDKLPNFLARPSKDNDKVSDHHRCTIHINTESMATIEKAYTDCLQGRPSDR